MKRIVLQCPVCSTRKSQVLPQELVDLRKNIQTNLILIKITENVVCSHSFYLEVDKNYGIRRYLKDDELERYYPGAHPPILTLR